MKSFKTNRRTLLTCAVLGMTTLGGQIAPAQEKIVDKGDFKVAYTKVKNPDYAEVQKELRDGKVLEEIAKGLNESIKLPEDIILSFGECGEANAFYDPNTRKITVCYEYIEDLYKVFGKEFEDEDELDDAVVGATVFVFFHELGHALVDVLDLPITGREEDAVDQLSTVLLADGTDEGEKMALDGALAFYLASKNEEKDIDEMAMWGEHSLSSQRFYSIICLVYGQNEEKYAHLVEKGILPEERAERCGGEWEQIETSWARILEPYLKD